MHPDLTGALAAERQASMLRNAHIARLARLAGGDHRRARIPAVPSRWTRRFASWRIPARRLAIWRLREWARPPTTPAGQELSGNEIAPMMLLPRAPLSRLLPLPRMTTPQMKAWQGLWPDRRLRARQRLLPDGGASAKSFSRS